MMRLDLLSTPQDRSRPRDHGTALLEFAVILPLLLLIGTTALELGRQRVIALQAQSAIEGTLVVEMEVIRKARERTGLAEEIAQSAAQMARQILFSQLPFSNGEAQLSITPFTASGFDEAELVVLPTVRIGSPQTPRPPTAQPACPPIRMTGGHAVAAYPIAAYLQLEITIPPTTAIPALNVDFQQPRVFFLGCYANTEP